MPLSRPVFALAGLGLAGLAVVGVGASATFTTSTTSSQTVTAGAIAMSVSAPGVSGCETSAGHCQALALPPVGPVGSTFESTPVHVTMTNTGNIAAYFSAIQISESDDGSSASQHLRDQMNICIMSHDPSGTWVEGNGALDTATHLTPSVQENPVKVLPGHSDTYWVSFYAGQDSSHCGSTTSSGPTTTGRWEGYSGGAYHTPASLTNDAMGGAVTPTLTFSFTG